MSQYRSATPPAAFSPSTVAGIQVLGSFFQVLLGPTPVQVVTQDYRRIEYCVANLAGLPVYLHETQGITTSNSLVLPPGGKMTSRSQDVLWGMSVTSGQLAIVAVDRHA